MARMPKCKYCKQEVNKETQHFFQKSSAYYHQSCYDEIQKEQNERNELLAKISKLYDISYPTGFMLKQIKQFHTERNYKYIGMAMTLDYMYQIENVVFDRNSGLGLIPFYYEKARAYYKKKYEAVESIPQEKVSTEVITVEASPVSQNRIKQTINIEDLL